MNIELIKTGIPINENDVGLFEKEIGHELPSFYRDYLIQFNGGKPAHPFFDVPTWQFKISLIQEFKGLDSNYIGVDLREIHLIKGDIFPSGFIAIGKDPGGNLILISLEGNTRGKIYFWDHELQPQDQLESLDEYVNLHPLADSFEQFILSLKREDEMEWD